MSKDVLPPSLSRIRSEIIKALYQDNCSKKGIPAIRTMIMEANPDLNPSTISTNIYAIAGEKKYLHKKAAGNQKRYYLSPLGTEVAKSLINNPGEIEVVENARRASKDEEQQEIEFDSLNISSNAASLADGLTAVIEENQQYRNLLLQVHQTIGKALKLN